MKKRIVGLIYAGMLLLVISATTFGVEYIARIDNMELGRIRVEYTKNGWISVSEIQYGEKYTIETRTAYGPNGFFQVYEATFKTNGELVAKILGVNKAGKTTITLYAYYDPKAPSVKTFTFTEPNIVLLDNNFIIPHFEMILRMPQPRFQILIPQALFNPSKTDKASGIAMLKRLSDRSYVLSYEGTEIKITTDEKGIVRMEYNNGIVVERLAEKKPGTTMPQMHQNQQNMKNTQNAPKSGK
ncbi:hypothetical protein Ferpe_0498 [Fervidobacterium pennivorans DSM 9078]|jgi:hypothetical protein|uniref:Uncharacterized protein n=1 Tax=Fervidobacterium pennivorans (strain DSM 9078 / Ven5) TaxID=771875 RepID=H9UAU3_FERPD|nr:hypothetical protein [Fervidobacterium pennivorans]AFG34636.1 hypothetical protein Ferpe_0498 [Fervidobacterium pennivorans DSM 9078]QIV77956.1 hypothetical protein HER11_02445 [Fervidobacterium pennivorans subsp. keratinolyticus]